MLAFLNFHLSLKAVLVIKNLAIQSIKWDLDSLIKRLTQDSIMRIAALFSGGKDSTYSIYLMKKLGHDVVTLLTIIPSSYDSMLFHYPNIGTSPYLAEAMALPFHQFDSKQPSTDAEASVLSDALKFMRTEYGIDGIVHGGISSNFQKNVFE